MLTARSIRDARPAAKAFIMWEAKLKGFGVRVAPGGTRTYVIDYSSPWRKSRAGLVLARSNPYTEDLWQWARDRRRDRGHRCG